MALQPEHMVVLDPKAPERTCKLPHIVDIRAAQTFRAQDLPGYLGEWRGAEPSAVADRCHIDRPVGGPNGCPIGRTAAKRQSDGLALVTVLLAVVEFVPCLAYRCHLDEVGHAAAGNTGLTHLRC